jgi:hypothetical protein
LFISLLRSAGLFSISMGSAKGSGAHSDHVDRR